MIFGVNGPKGPAAADKAKAKKTGGAGGPSFASMLEEASHSDTAGETFSVGSVGVGAYVPLEDEMPRDAQGQARALLKTLKDLAEDAYAGEPTAAVGKLEALARDVDESGLNAQQKAALDEVRTRAAVEVAKLKA